MGSWRHKKRSFLWNQQQLQLSVCGCKFLGTVFILSVIFLFTFSNSFWIGDRDGYSANVEEDKFSGSRQQHTIQARIHRPSDRSFALAAVIFNRVFKEDLFNITSYECKQWIEYLIFAGVEHIFWYDTAHSDEESQESHLRAFVDQGLLTYHRFHQLFPGNIEEGYHFEQDNSYEHFLASHAGTVRWVVEMDVDEYPFMQSRTQEFFLKEYILGLETSRPDVSQILMPCMIFGGNPKGDLENGWVIERYQRRKRSTEGLRPGHVSRTKPIFRASLTAGVTHFDPHQFQMKEGTTLVSDPEILRMNHYWGPRLSDFGPDTPDVLALLVPDASIQPIATAIKLRTGLTSKAQALS